MFPRLAPLLLDVGVGAAVGFVRDNDHKNAATRTTLTKQIGTWVEGGALAVGLLGEMGNFLPRNFSEPLLSHGAAFLTERVTRSALSGKIGNPLPMAINGARAPAMAGLSAYNASTTRAFATKEVSPTVF